MVNTGTYTQHPALAELPPLVRRQRTLEAQVVELAPIVDDEKAIRAQIDRLLVEAGLVAGDAVTCNGYDVMHHLRAGSHRLNQAVLIAQLVAGGVDRAFVDQAIAVSTETGDASTWATVKPSKGSRVVKKTRA
jgi:hypothetical protein